MYKFILFANKNTGYEFLKLLIQNNIIPGLVITQTPGDAYLSENGIKRKYKTFKFFISEAVKRNIYKELFDVYYLCKEHDIPVLSEKFANDRLLINKCKELGIEGGIIFTFSIIIKKSIIESFKYGIINFHPALLPKHRGLDPLFWAIYNEDKISGITFHLIDEKIDRGKILFQKKYQIKENETVDSLKTALINMGIEEIIYFFKNGKFNENENVSEEKIEESYDKIIPADFFEIDVNTCSDKIKKLFKSTFADYKPYILINKKKIEFRRYEIEDEKINRNINSLFILKNEEKSMTIKTGDNKIIKLFI